MAPNGGEPMPKFDVGYHSQITQAAAAGVLSDEQLGFVIAADISQDLLQTESRVHFDNCAFPEGAAHILDEWATVDHASDRFSIEALTAFGRLLHTVQDFYAHSNWIELHEEVAPVPVWDLDPASLPAKIVSGTWWMGSPKKCGPGAPTHAQLNKDKPTSEEGRKVVGAGPNAGRTLFDLAIDTATRATVVQVQRLTEGKAVPAASVEALTAPMVLEAVDLLAEKLTTVLDQTATLRERLNARR